MREDFKNIVMFHGVSATEYSTPKQAFKKIKAIAENPEWEICCSNVHYGNIGIICTGDVIVAYNDDVSSLIDDNGHRYTDNHDDECTLEQWNNSVGTEAWVKNVKIHGIWIDEFYANQLVRSNLLKNFAKFGNIEIINHNSLIAKKAIDEYLNNL